MSMKLAPELKVVGAEAAADVEAVAVAEVEEDEAPGEGVVEDEAEEGAAADVVPTNPPERRFTRSTLIPPERSLHFCR